jgi:SAM-dependent methyltransferase
MESFLEKHGSHFRDKIVIDIPSGSGGSSLLLKDGGAKVEAFDLFPEYFEAEGIECRQADLTEKLPVADGYSDFVLCQEGIEHVPDQLNVFRELNRILKVGGGLLLTTPNYSNIKSRLSYLLSESEYFYKIMPPNEADCVWFSEDRRYYLGHIFLIGIQKLRVLARLSGFRLKAIYPIKSNKTSILLLPLLYPLIYMTNLMGYVRALRRNSNTERRALYKELFKLGINTRVLTEKFLFVEFVKEYELDEMAEELSKY